MFRNLPEKLASKFKDISNTLKQKVSHLNQYGEPDPIQNEQNDLVQNTVKSETASEEIFNKINSEIIVYGYIRRILDAPSILNNICLSFYCFQPKTLKINDKVDHCDLNGKWCIATIIDKDRDDLRIHYDGYSSKWDTWSHSKREIHKFAVFKSKSTISSINENGTYQYKLVLLGDTQTGKTSISVRFVKGQFSEYEEPTIGAAFLTQTIRLKDYDIKYEIWDAAGVERYHSLAPMYYRHAAVIIVVYDITSLMTFNRAKLWIKEVQRQGPKNAVIVLIGNKIDREQDRQVCTVEAQQYANDNNMYFMETSAKINTNITELFVAIAGQLPKTEGQKDTSQGFVLDSDYYQPVPQKLSLSKVFDGLNKGKRQKNEICANCGLKGQLKKVSATALCWTCRYQRWTSQLVKMSNNEDD